MAIRRTATSTRTTTPPETAALAHPNPSHSIIASAANIPLDGLSFANPHSTRGWQREIWGYLENVGELRYACSWAGSAISRTRLYMAEVGDDGDIAGETKNRKARAIAAKTLGGPATRRESLRTLGFNLFGVGDAYIVAMGATDTEPESWAAVSIDAVKRKSGDIVAELERGDRVLKPGRDILTRAWTPHPRKPRQADSPVRSARVVLRELQILTQFVFAQGESRIASAGILWVPAGMSAGDGETTAEDLTRKLVEVAAESLAGKGTASSTVPIVVEVPLEALGKIQYSSLASELSKQAMELRKEAVRRFATGVDMPIEVLTGMSDASHWSSWWIDESSVKIHIEPLLTRICEALQFGFVGPALKAVGLDPQKYRIWFDTSPLTVRPQRLKETLELYAQGIVSKAAVLAAGAYLASDAPSDEEDIRRYIRELVLRDPQMFNQASIRTLVGITEQMIPTESIMAQPIDAGDGTQLLTEAGTPPPPPPAPKRLPPSHVVGEPPVRDRSAGATITASVNPTAITDLARIVLADAVALRALELAGGRLLDHRTRLQHRDIPRHEIHTVVTASEDRIDRLIDGAFTHLPELAATVGMGDPDDLRNALDRYVRRMIISGRPHDRGIMTTDLKLFGVIDADA